MLAEFIYLLLFICSTSLNYLLASVAGLSFYPQWITHLLMTAGIDSNYKIPIQHFIKVPFCWLKLSTKFPTCYLSAVCFFFRELVRELNGKSDEVLTRQPDQHHRVVFQPPPSLDGGLDGQSMLLFLYSFYCLSKAMARILPIGETFQRIVQSCKPEGLFLSNQTLFSSKPELHHRMFLCINNCPCSYTLSGSDTKAFYLLFHSKSSNSNFATDVLNLTLRSIIANRSS